MITPDRSMVAAAKRLRASKDRQGSYAIDHDAIDTLATLLDRLAVLAPFWHEPYAAPFVPIIEAGARLAGAIVGDPTTHPQTPEESA